MSLYTGAPGYERWLPYEKVKAAHVLYRSGMSMYEIAEQIYERYGYKNAETCECSLARAFRNNGLARRTHAEARRLAASRERCKGCGGPMEERRSGCVNCRRRHNEREKHGLPFIALTRSCAKCGCSLEERTRGCGTCTQRHFTRKQRGAESVESPFLFGCDGCGCELDNRTRGCGTCNSRHYRRKKRAASSSPASRTAAGGGTPSLERTVAA